MGFRIDYDGERTPILAKPRVYVRSQTISSIIVSLGSFNAGSMLGWSSPAHADLRGNTSVGSVDEYNLAWLSISCMVGLILGSLAAGLKVKNHGRRVTLLALTIPCFVGWQMMALASNIWLLASGRLITGFCGGAFCVITPLYISEIAHDSIRGRLATFSNAMLSSGIVYSYIIGSLVSWEWMSAICGVFPLILFLGSWSYLRETPIHLIETQRTEDAYQVLNWLHGPACSNEFIETKFKEIFQTVQTDLESGSMASLFQPYSWKPILISLTLFACQQLCGVNAIIFFSTDIFTLAGTNWSPNISAILVASTQAIFVALSSIAIDKVGRKALMIISEAGMSVSCLIMGFYFYSMEQNNNIPPLGLGWIPELSLVIYMIAYSIGAAPLPWLLMAELCPNHLRGLSSSFVSAFCWFLALIIVGTFGPLVSAVGASSVFWGYCGLTALGCVFVILCLPETKGKSLLEINLCFKDQ